MPNKRYRRPRSNWLPYAVCALCILASAAGLIAIFARIGGDDHAETVPAMAQASGAPALTLDLKPTPTAEPTATPEPTQAPASFVYLPVVEYGPAAEKVIAITVDDCYQMENLKAISATAYQNGGRLTLFPIGQNVVRDGMAEILQACVFQMGFEIENHTWSHSRIFRLPEDEMAAEIWKQSVSVSLALGVNYQQNFFRLMGGDGARDQRTHNYLKQLGYQAIADWTISGSDASMDKIQAALRPGAIYLFHTTDADTQKLLQFIPYAVSQGYQLVTLNELFGLPANTMTDIATLSNQMPAPQPYTPEYLQMQKGDYSWSVVLIQQRLHELGFLADSSKTATAGNVADGVYGDSTAYAIAAYQNANGLPVTGVADEETQRRLLGEA